MKLSEYIKHYMYLNVIFELSDNLKKLYVERIQFNMSIGKKSKMYVLCKK